MAGVSRLDDVLTALVTVCQAAVGTKVPVYDGRPATDQPDVAFVLIGDDGDTTGGGNPAGVTTQTRVESMTGATTETGNVTCALICQTGDDDFPGLRAASRGLMFAIETAIRADRTLGGVATRSNVDEVTLWQSRNSLGTFIRRVFIVHYDASQG